MTGLKSDLRCCVLQEGASGVETRWVTTEELAAAGLSSVQRKVAALLAAPKRKEQQRTLAGFFKKGKPADP